MDAQPIRIILHFGFPVGATLGPLILIPFLVDDEDSESTELICYENATLSTENNTNMAGSEFVNNVTCIQVDIDSNEEDKDESTIQYAFLIVGLFLLFIAVLFYILQCLGHIWTKLAFRAQVEVHDQKFDSFKKVFSPKEWADGDKVYGTVVFIFLAVYFVLELATIKGTQQYLVTYAVDSDHFKTKEAVLMNSVTFATGMVPFNL